MSKSYCHPALFLDRDGVVNKEVGYISNISKIVFQEHIFNLCRFFKDKSFKIVIVTNQSGIGRNIITHDQYIEINSFILKKFQDEKCSIDLILTSTIDPRDTKLSQTEIFRRKPNPGLILESKLKLDLDLNKSLFIGDNLTDMQAGKSAGIHSLFLVKDPMIHGDYFESFVDIKSCLVRLSHVFNR
jgi:D-glycero-D-manno-heptose 1,7-bisphosphate phosphatase